MKPPEDCASIEDVHKNIDALDREIAALIGRRAGYVTVAARFKTGESSVRAPERRKAMLDVRRQWTQEESLDPDVIENVYLPSSTTSSNARCAAGEGWTEF